jgi:hypothetical protein
MGAVAICSKRLPQECCANSHRNYAHFLLNRESEERKNSKMVGAIAFDLLDPPDGRAATPARGTYPDDATLSPEPGQQGHATAGAAIPVTPLLPFAPGSRSYTQLWTSQSATVSAKEMRDNMEAYVETYTDASPDYNVIQTAILNSVEWMEFLMVMARNQVILVHSTIQ